MAGAELNRSLGFGLLVLYGLGTTVGAGIYALIGEIVSVAGQRAPWSFLVASVLAGLTAFSFAELSGRFPRAAGAALYVQNGLGVPSLARLVGLLVVVTGVVSSAALINGMTGYMQAFLDLPDAWLMIGVLVLLAAIAVWGIEESVWTAGVISVLEVGGLIWIILLSMGSTTWSEVNWHGFVPRADHTMPIIAGAVLSFYAYIGFEDMVEVAEEVKDVRRVLPRAIVATLLITSLVYVLLLSAVLMAVGPAFLANAEAPLADVYRHLTGGEGIVLGLIAIFAIVNGALIQIVMASRVIYGLASRGQLPGRLAYVHPRFKTPLFATLVVAALVLTLALLGHLSILAEVTSVVMLSVFSLINLSLWRLKGREPVAPGLFSIPRWVPLCGFLVCGYFVVHAVTDWIAR